MPAMYDADMSSFWQNIRGGVIPEQYRAPEFITSASTPER